MMTRNEKARFAAAVLCEAAGLVIMVVTTGLVAWVIFTQ